MGRFAGRIVIGAVALAAVLGFAGTAAAADPTVTLGADGKTAPVFDYTQAIRERVFIPQPGVDQDSNGEMDFVTADIIRPKESGPGSRCRRSSTRARTTRPCAAATSGSAWRTGRRRRQRPLAAVL